MPEVLSVASFFSGVGGIDLAFNNAGFSVVFANELDANACKTYKENFNSLLVSDDINNLNPADIPATDVIVGGFPCQAFSIAGYQKGFADPRGNLFFSLAKIISIKKPKAIFFENVKNLARHDNGKTLQTIINCLEQLGYHIKYKVLNAYQYGNIPQNRERIYIVGFLNKSSCDAFEFPEEIPLTQSVVSFIDIFLGDPKYFYTKQNFSYFDKLMPMDFLKIYQWRRVYLRKNKKGLCPTLTANMGTGGHNVPLVKTVLGIRKLSPRECFSLMGFPRTFKLPRISNTQLYKQAGNAVVVPVVKRIAEEIKKVL